MVLLICKSSFRSLRDLFLFLILIMVLSIMMTINMSRHLPWLHPQPELSIHVDGHLNIYRSLQLSDGQEDGWRKRAAARRTTRLGKQIPEQHRALLQTLAQLEDLSLPQKSKLPIVILAEGSLSAIKHEVPLIESAFRQHGAEVKFNVKPDSVVLSRTVQSVTEKKETGAWTVLMCLNTRQSLHGCQHTSTHDPSHSFQKVNVIPQLQSLLFEPQLLCERDKEGHGKWQGEPLSCYFLPKQMSSLKSSPSGIGCGNHTMWILQAGEDGVLASLKHCKQLAEENMLTSGDGVAVTLPSQIYHIDAQPLIVQFHVLVMSLSPLRLYLHPEGLAWEGFSAYVHKKPQRSVTVQEFQQLITDVRGHDLSSAAMSQLEEVIVRAMFTLESTANRRDSANNCQSCFQLLEVAMVFNTTFHPFLLQVKPYAHKGKMASLNEYVVRQRILEDLAVMLVSRETVVADVAMGLSELGLTFPTQNGLCNFDESFCLSDDQLLYSLDNRREFFKKGNFIKLYPATSAVKYTSLLQTMYPVSRGVTGMAATPAQTGGHTSTADLHSYLLSLESFYADLDKEDTVLSYDDMNIPIDFEVVPNINSSSLQNMKSPSISHVSGQTKVHCDKDPASMPYLQKLYIHPVSELSPEFSPFMTEYHVTVDYNVLHITVWAFAKSCSSQARMEDKHGVSRVGNFTLGIGENRISVVVVDMSYAEPWVLNTYTLVIQRLPPDYQQTSFLPGLPHQVCSLKQDCALWYAPREPCGLQDVGPSMTWSRFLQTSLSLPQCQVGDASGRWYVPCKSCANTNSCYWQQATWQPDACQFQWLPRGKVKQCFEGKKVLFIGDSTNRGILHYMMEQVNGSLHEWDKTHHLRVYSMLNNNHTAFSFAYYPQFWLPTEHRPVLDKALYQLIKKNKPLQNNSNTVLVVGGVHWLAKHHIDVVLKALNREGLTGIRLVVKGLGSGFHQPVSGVHCLSKKDHQRLLSHNQATLRYAKANGFSVIDTYNMTMARYKDFLQGKCACHFHRVTMTKREHVHKSAGSKRLVNAVSTGSAAVYHVEGEINAAYSEMMISQICRGS